MARSKNVPLAVHITDDVGDPTSVTVTVDGTVTVGNITQYQLGFPAGATDYTIMAGAVRNDTNVTLVDTDLDRAPLSVSNNGSLWVKPDINGFDVNVSDLELVTTSLNTALGDTPPNALRDAPAIRNEDGTTITNSENDYSSIAVDRTGAVQVANITTSVTPGTGTDHLGKREGDASGGTDVGVVSFGYDGANGVWKAIPLDGDNNAVFTYVVNGISIIGNPVTVSPSLTPSGEQFVTTGDGGTTDWQASYPGVAKYFSIQVVQQGTVTSWDVRLEGSMNNSAFGQIIQHTKATEGDGGIKAAVTTPCRYFRCRVAGLVLGGGTSITVYITASN